MYPNNLVLKWICFMGQPLAKTKVNIFSCTKWFNFMITYVRNKCNFCRATFVCQIANTLA